MFFFFKVTTQYDFKYIYTEYITRKDKIVVVLVLVVTNTFLKYIRLIPFITSIKYRLL